MDYHDLPFVVNLLGGAEANEGNVFARNPSTSVYGPVCDDGWDMNDVRIKILC